MNEWLKVKVVGYEPGNKIVWEHSDGRIVTEAPDSIDVRSTYPIGHKDEMRVVAPTRKQP